MSDKYPPYTLFGDATAVGEEYYRLVAESKAETLALAERAEQEADPVPADFEWLASQCERVDSSTAEEDGTVYWECGEVSFTCDNRQDDHGEPWVAVAVDWRIGWEPLPRALVPVTRGQFRTLCRLANT